MTIAPPRRRALLLLAVPLAAIGGCASYRPAPLRDPTAVLAPPDRAALATAAAAIDRPYLAPEAIDLGRPLTPNALAIIAVLENPDLRALRAKLGVADAQAFAARLLPDPQIQANFDRLVAGPDPYNAFGGQLAFDLGRLVTGGATRARNDAARRQVRLDIAWAEWQTASEARLQGARLLALDWQLALLREGEASARLLAAATSRAAARGDVSAADAASREQAALDAADRLRSAEGERATVRGALDRLLGLPPGTPLRLAPPPPPREPPAASALVAQAIERRLDLQALRAGYAVAEAEVHTAILEQFPNLALTLAGARDTSDNRTVGPAIGFTLPLWNRNRGGIAIATATRAQLRAEYEARLAQTRAEIATAVARLAIVRRQRAQVAAAMPALQRIADRSVAAARRGDLSQAAAATAVQAVRDRAYALAQLDQQLAEQTIALELLSGGPSEGWNQ